MAEYLGIVIDYSRDKDITEQGLALLTGEGFYKMEHETSPQQGLARASTCYSFGDYEFAQRIYDYASKGFFTFAGAPLINAVEVNWPTFNEDEFHTASDWLEENVVPTGMPINCFLSLIPDTKEGLVKTREETAWLSMMGGGIGIYSSNRSPDDKSTGVLAHLRGYDADALSYKQTASKRGSVASYLDITHPEVLSFLSMRDPVGGDQNKKCFNLHNAVILSDDFMERVIENKDYELVDPKHGRTGSFLNAREVFEEVLERRFETGEPYIMFKDTVNKGIPDWITHPLYNVSQSNLCVAPETQILTDVGYLPIGDLEGQEVEVWNGEEFSKTTVIKTGEKQELLKVKTNFNHTLECTPYHKFYITEGYKGNTIERRACDLKVGDKLIKFDLPVIAGDRKLDKAYTNGFFSADGSSHKGRDKIYLYNEKMDLKEYFEEDIKWCDSISGQTRSISNSIKGLKPKYFVPDATYTVKSRLEWLSGYMDGDGTVAVNGDNHSLQCCSININFLKEMQYMLQTLGVDTKLVAGHQEGWREMPQNDGSNKYKDYWCKETFRLLINSNGLWHLSELGFETKRLQWNKRKPQREASRFVTVEEVQWTGRREDTYCFSESKRGMGMFNGILTGQCSEITLRTSDKRTAVCCLSSLNLEKYDEWKDTNIVQDLVRLLDNVLEYFIRLAPATVYRAIHSASKERAIGLGTLGWHSYLQSKMIPFESGGFGSAIQETHKIYKSLKERGIEESKRLAILRGEAPDCHGSGMRNSHLFAIAPNATSSSRVGTSPSIEPWNSNAFNAQGRAGSFLIRNKHLEQLLESKGKNTKEVWKDILTNKGSVQQLDFLTDLEKKVFKTASEIDQFWVIEQASARQEYICQSQSVNLAVKETITKQGMVDLHVVAWLKGLKTLYYCRAEGSEKANLSTRKEIPTERLGESDCLACEG